MKPPMNEPTTPSSSVPEIDIGSRPGTSKRATQPAINAMMANMMRKVITELSLLRNVYPARVLIKQRGRLRRALAELCPHGLRARRGGYTPPRRATAHDAKTTASMRALAGTTKHRQAVGRSVAHRDIDIAAGAREIDADRVTRAVFDRVRHELADDEHGVVDTVLVTPTAQRRLCESARCSRARGRRGELGRQ